MSGDSQERGTHHIVSGILRASLLVGLAHIIFKLLGLVQLRLIGKYFDEFDRDLFSFAFESFFMAIFLIGEESLGPAFLPVFMGVKQKDGEKDAWAFASTVLTLQFVVITLVVAICALIPEHIVGWVTAWDRDGVDAYYMKYAPQYVRYMSFGLYGMCLGSTTYMLLNGYKRFFLAALGDAALKLGLVACIIACMVVWGTDSVSAGRAVWVLCAGLVLGSLFKMITHAIGLRSEIGALRPRLHISSTHFRKFAWLVIPLLGGILFAKVRDMFNEAYIMSYVSEAGLMANLKWGKKLFNAIMNIVPYAVSIAMFPFFCELAEGKDRKELGRLVSSSSRVIFLFCMPLAAILLVLSLPVSQVLFQTGKFTIDNVQLASFANQCYMPLLPFFALEMILMQAFFAQRRMIAVTVAGIVFSSVSMLIAGICVLGLGWSGMWALGAVAGGFALSRILKTIFLAWLLHRESGAFAAGETLFFLLRIVIISLCSAAVSWWVSTQMPGTQNRDLPLLFVKLAVAGGAGGLVCCGGMWLLCREECRRLLAWTIGKLKRTKREQI